MTSCSAIKAGRKEGAVGDGDVQSGGVCLPMQPLHMMKPCFAGDG